MREFLLYLLYRMAVALITAIPAETLFRLGNLIGFCAWLILPHYRHLAFHNVCIAFEKEKTPGELRRLVRRHFQRLGGNLLCGVKVAVMPLIELEQRVEIENLDAITRHLRQKRGVAVVLSHLGNWELNSQSMPKYIGHVRNSTIYQKLGNRLIDEHVRKLRARVGVEMFDRKDGFNKAIELLRGGGVIGILSDQHAGDQGLWTPFFGKLASTTPLPALLAKRTGAALVSLAVYTVGPARWRISVESPLDTANESIESLTASCNEIIAEQIRRAPEDWFWVHNRWKTPRPNFLLSRYKREFPAAKILQQQAQAFRILIRSSNWLGDAVMSIPTVRAIKNGRPDARLVMLSPAKLVPLWQLIPEVDKIVPLESKSLFAAVRAIKSLRMFDVGILFPNSLRSALELYLAGVPRRVGYRGHARAWFLNQIVRERKKAKRIEHHSRHYLRVAHELGADVAAKQGTTVTRKPDNALPPSGSNERTKVALCPGAEYGPAKRWLPERFIETAAAVANVQAVQWILFGTKNESALGDEIAKALGDQCVNRIGQTTLEELIQELQNCRLLLTNDTGTMHLAALLGVPVVAIFGSTEPALTGPMGSGHVVLRHHVECSPCFLRECPIDFRCMTTITVQEAKDAILSILNGKRDRTQ